MVDHLAQRALGGGGAERHMAEAHGFTYIGLCGHQRSKIQ